jgi:hypothetical protein
MNRCLLSLAFVLALVSVARADEDAKIEALIRAVASLKDAQFIRNGKSYDAVEAAQHLRDKWKWKKSDIKTARDFIDIAASRSTETGQPYKIRWKDGRELFSAEFLERELKKLEAR